MTHWTQAAGMGEGFSPTFPLEAGACDSPEQQQYLKDYKEKTSAGTIYLIAAWRWHSPVNFSRFQCIFPLVSALHRIIEP